MSHLDAPVAPAPERPTRRSRTAVAGLALGLASCLVSAIPSLLAASLAAGGLAVVLGLVALRGLRRDATGSTGRGLAVAGLALGALAVVVGAVVGAVLATAGPAQDGPGTTPGAAAGEESGVVGDGDGSPAGEVTDPGEAGGDAGGDSGGDASDAGSGGGDDGTAPHPDAASPQPGAPGGDTVQAAASGVTGLRALLGTGLAVTDRGSDGGTDGGTNGSERAGTVPAGGTPARPATPQPSASEDPGDPWCEVLAEAAVARSREDAGDGVALSGVRASTVAEDHRDDWGRSAREGEEALVLSCRGTASWSDGTRSPVLTRLVVDEDGELVVGFVTD